MERVLDRLAALDPGALPLLGREVPLWAAIPMALGGVVFLVAGSRRTLRRVVAALAGGVAGYFLVPPALKTLGASFAHADWVGAGALGLAGAIRPAVLAFVAGGLGAGLLALSFWPGKLLAAALPALCAGGLLATLFRHAIFSLAAAALGAGLVAVGVTSILLRTSAAGPVASYPIVALAAAGLLFICGAAYQLTRPAEGKRAAMPVAPALKRRAG